jgi:hypothetical protein
MPKALTLTKVFCLVIGIAAGVAFAEDAPADQVERNAERPGRHLSSTEKFTPNGLVVVLPSGKQNEQKELLAINNPYINGVAVQMNWRDIEATQGQIDWSRLDEIFAAAESTNKWVQLLIFPGFFAPEWAKDGTQSDLFPIQYGPGAGTVERLPMPWDQRYLTRWFAFLKEVSVRYGQSPAFKMIAADGPTSVSAEMTLPNKPQDHKKWLSNSYTVEKYLGAWQQVFHVYAAVFPNQCISLSGPGLPVLGPGRKQPGERMRAKLKIVAQASAILGHRLALQWSDLHAGRSRVAAPERDFVNSYSGRIVTGFQMRCAAEGDSRASRAMGAEGNPPLALRRSIDEGMQLNNRGQHINYLEIYERDVVAEEMQPVLGYGASLFANFKPESKPSVDQHIIVSPGSTAMRRYEIHPAQR